MPAQVNFDEIRLLDRRQVAEAVGRSPDTLDGWVRDGLFPPPLQARPGGPKQWKLTTVRDWIAKRQRSRYQPPARRGRLRRGKIRTIPTRDPNVVQEVYLIRGGGPVDCDGPPPHKYSRG